jgi:hypothetical protein
MLRKIFCTLIFMANLIGNHVYATEYTFSQMTGYNFELTPNTPQVFTNNFFITLEARCTIISPNPNNSISFNILRKSGSLNDMKLSAGDSVTLITHPGENIHIIAVSGGKIQLTNNSDTEITASCTLVK